MKSGQLQRSSLARSYATLFVLMLYVQVNIFQSRWDTHSMFFSNQSGKQVNPLEHVVFSIKVENSGVPDQMASSETI